MIIPPRFLDEIRNRLSLSDIIGKRVKVTRTGREFKACCPFHHEKTPSFTINDDKQFYHCFGCGAHGDVIGFTMRHDNLSFIDAIEALSAEAGLQMPKPDPEAIKKAEHSKSLHDLLEASTKWFEANLYAPDNEKVLDYLLGRGLTRETLSAFRVGYAPADRQAMRAHLKTEGYKDVAMIEAGVLRPPGKDGQPYAFFRERVMFPVSDRRGRPVAYGGRILPDHLRPPDQGDYKPAKYMNSSDTPLFDKGRMLYGESLARQSAGDGQSVIVTEGYMDVIACHQAGFKGAVAPMGTALTEEQILSLWKMIPADEKVPLLCFDGDNAGRRAASRSCERILPLLKPGQSVRFSFLPDGEDPDTMIRTNGAAGFKKILDGALSLFDFIWAAHTAGKNFETPESRAGVIKALENEVNVIADPDVQRHYKAILREKISETFFARRQKSGRVKKSPALKVRRPAFNQSALYPKIFLAALLNHPHIYESMEEVIGNMALRSKSLDQVRQKIVSIMNENPDLDSAALQNHLIAAGFEQEIGDILSESVYVHAAFCAPHFDSGLAEGRLQAWLGEVGQRDWTEIKAGWKEAFYSSSEDDEAKLRELIQAKVSDSS